MTKPFFHRLFLYLLILNALLSVRFRINFNKTAGKTWFKKTHFPFRNRIIIWIKNDLVNKSKNVLFQKIYVLKSFMARKESFINNLFRSESYWVSISIHIRLLDILCIVSSSCASKVNKAIFFIDFSVPPNVPVIVNEAGREATSQLGPYPEGATTQISCEVRGGELCNLQIYYFVWSYNIISEGHISLSVYQIKLKCLWFNGRYQHFVICKNRHNSQFGHFILSIWR